MGSAGMGPGWALRALTGRVPEHGPSIHAAPAEAFDHHSHAGHFVPRELLQCCLRAPTSWHRSTREGGKTRGGGWDGAELTLRSTITTL